MVPRIVLEAPDITPSQLLNYNATYRIVLCTQCQYAIQPSGIVRHLKEIHQIKRSNRRPFMEYVSQFSLASPEEVFQMPIHKFPVPGFPELDGLHCESDGCDHLCVSEKRMRSHWVADHGRTGSGKDGDWKTARLQTFFRGNLLRYFTAPESLTEIGIEKQKFTRNYPHTKAEYYQTKSPGISSSLDDIWVKDMTELLLERSTTEVSISLDEKDSFLLEHYLVHTAPTIGSDPVPLQLWQEAIPLVARSHPFLLHGLLALSALHLAHKTPNSSPLYSEYCISATTHQNTAMPVFRSTIEAVTTETCHAVLAFSHLLVLYSFASESQDERLLIISPTPDLTPVWLHFLRTGCELLCNVWDDLENGPVKALVCAWDVPELEDDGRRLPLVENLLAMIPPKKTANSWTEEETDTYTDTAILLGHAFTSGTKECTFTTWDALRIWPMYSTSKNIQMIRDKHPGALILLAHYCVLLKKLEGFWFFDGRATALLKNVVACLDQRWMSGVRWPMEQIGMSVVTQECEMNSESWSMERSGTVGPEREMLLFPICSHMTRKPS